MWFPGQEKKNKIKDKLSLSEDTFIKKGTDYI